MVGFPILILIYILIFVHILSSLLSLLFPYYHFYFLIGQDTSLLLGKDTIHFKEEHTTNF